MALNNTQYPYSIGDWVDKMIKQPEEEIKEDSPIMEYIQTIKTFQTSLQSILNFRISSENKPSLAMRRYKIPEELREFYFVYVSKIEGKDLVNIKGEHDQTKIDHFKKTIEIKGNKIFISDTTTRLIYQQFRQHEEKIEGERTQDLYLTLLSLASIFEVLVNKLLEYHLLYVEKGPGSLGEKQIKYSEIYNLESVDIKKKFADSFIESIMYKSFDDWIEEFFKICCDKKYDISRDSYIIPLKKSISEMYQRRNIIIHNNGIVNQVYKTKVPDTPYELGERIKITDEYLEELTLKVSIMGNYMITQHIKNKRMLKNRELYDSLETICLELLNNDRFAETRLITNILRKKVDFQEDDTWLSDIEIKRKAVSDFIHRYNYWLSYYLEGLESIPQRDIQKYINKNKGKEWFKQDEQIQLGISSLTDSRKEFASKAIRYCREMEQVGKVSLLRTLEWPMFRLISDEENFIDYSNETKYNVLVKESEGEITMLNNNNKEMEKKPSNKNAKK